MTTAAPDARFLTFFVGKERFAVNAADVLEIFRPPPLTRVPNGPPSLMGIGSLRGLPAPVISLARLLGRHDPIAADFRLLLIDAGQAVGLAVDRIGSLTQLPDGAAADGRLYLIDDEDVRPLDLDALLKRDFSARPVQALRRATQSGADVETAPRRELSFLTFALAGQLYALPIEEVAGAVALPPSLTVMAQSDETVLGIATVQNRLLPIVSLRLLLGLPPEQPKGAKVVVARIGGASIGLAVDRLQAILRVPEETIDPAPAVLNRGAGEAQVRSICRLPGNKGLVAILSSERLFREAAVARILAERQEGSGTMKAADKEGGAERFLIFRLDEEEYGLPLDAVEEVVRLPSQLTRVPNAPSFVQGVMPLRGKAIPVIDQRVRFASGSSGSEDTRPRIIVTSIEGRKAGFIVDAAAEIIAIAPDSISATPELAAEAGRLFSRVASLDGGKRLILLIEPREMLEKAERDLLARLDASLITDPA